MLLKIIAVRRPHLVPIGDLVEVLWAGEDPPSQAAENVATLVSRLRDGPNARSLATALEVVGAGLSPAPVSVLAYSCVVTALTSV